MSAQAANGRRPRRRRPGLSAGWRHNWRPSAQQYAIARFSPLMKPASSRPWRNPRSRPDARPAIAGRRGRPRRRATEQRDELTRFPLMGMHLIPSRVRNASLGYRIGADQSGGRCTAKFQSSLCRLRVKTGKSRSEQMFSGLPPETGLPQRIQRCRRPRSRHHAALAAERCDAPPRVRPGAAKKIPKRPQPRQTHPALPPQTQLIAGRFLLFASLAK